MALNSKPDSIVKDIISFSLLSIVAIAPFTVLLLAGYVASAVLITPVALAIVWGCLELQVRKG